MMAEFKRQTQLQKYQLQRLNEVVADYLKLVELPKGSRHRKTTLIFTGDRFKPFGIDCRFVAPKQDNIDLPVSSGYE